MYFKDTAGISLLMSNEPGQEAIKARLRGNEDRFTYKSWGLDASGWRNRHVRSPEAHVEKAGLKRPRAISVAESVVAGVRKKAKVGHADAARLNHVDSADAIQLQAFRIIDAPHTSTGWGGAKDSTHPPPESFLPTLTGEQHLMAYKKLGYACRPRGDRRYVFFDDLGMKFDTMFSVGLVRYWIRMVG